MAESVPNPAPAIDWADDTDDEIDFGAPVFSDDDELAAELAMIQADRNYGASKHASSPTTQQDNSAYSSSPRHTTGFNDSSNRSLDRRSQNDSSQTMNNRSNRGRENTSYRDSPDSSHYSHSSYSSPRGSTPVDGDRFKAGPPRRERDFGGDSRGSFGSPQNDSSSRWTSRNNEDHGRSSGQQQQQKPARQIIPLPPKPTVTPDRPHMDRSRSPSYRSRSPLPGTAVENNNSRPIHRDRPYQQRTQSPYRDHSSTRSLSPSSAYHSQPLSHGLSTRSLSPARQQQPRTYMDQVIRANEQQARRRSRDLPSEGGVGGGRWEKTPHEDKPYPTLQHSTPAPAHTFSHSPKDKDDTVYFLGRGIRNNENNGSIQKSEPLWTSELRKNAGTMYHEREKLTANNLQNHSKYHGSNASNGSNDRWEKGTHQEPDLPYPERSSPSNHHNNSSISGGLFTKSYRANSRGQSENSSIVSSSSAEKISARGTRGKGKEQKRRSKDQSLHGVATGDDDERYDKDVGSEVPWWEQSTYGAKKAELAATPTETSKPATSTPVTDTKSSAKLTLSETKEEKPWWEQSTYGVKPRTATSTTATTTATTTTTSNDRTSSTNPSEADTMARRKALGEKTLVSGVEALTLVSRGDDSTGSRHSIKNRNVQERVFAEIKAMITKYEAKYGSNKMEPIPLRSRQSEEIDIILESFRKLREGLFATEARDLFSVEVYEQSVLYSLYAGNIPELTKALHHLVQELHPVIYKVKTDSHCSNDDHPFARIPARRQTFLGLYILHHIAKPTRTLPSKMTEDPLFQTVSHPKTETDELIASFLYLFQHPQRTGKGFQGHLEGLQPDLRLALEYWAYLRQGNWVGRERLLGNDRARAGGLPISWEQRLMIQHSMSDSLGSSRTQSVAIMQKAYYSLPISVMAQGIGLVEPGEKGMKLVMVQEEERKIVEKMKSAYGLLPNVVVRDSQFMFKAKS